MALVKKYYSGSQVCDVLRELPNKEFLLMLNAFAKASGADVVERKAGKWVEQKVIEDGKAIEEWQSAKCSVCGKYHTTPYLYNFDDFDYCPNCGVRMESE